MDVYVFYVCVRFRALIAMYMYTYVFVEYAVLPEPTEFKFCGEREMRGIWGIIKLT